jgi:hypothetical protein
VTALFLLAMTVLQDPAILEVRTITDGHARSGCWLPLKVRVGGPAGFEGEVVGSADAGFRVARPFQIPASGTVDLLVPVVVLGRDAKVEVHLRGPDGDLGPPRALQTMLTFLGRERLVLVDPRHPEFESLRQEEIRLPKENTLVRFASSDPSDWNEAAEMGAFEVVDAVVASDARAPELTMYVWRALSGGIVTQPRRDLLERLEDPASRFPAIDPIVGRFSVNESWIPRKRDATLLFVVIYGFGFFVAVYVTWSRKSGGWLLLGSALGMSGLFIAAYSAFYPKGNLAIRSWQGIVDAPETPVAISISALWGSGRAAELEFGRIVKPVHATHFQAASRHLELRRTPEGLWKVRGASPGDPTRFVTVEKLSNSNPFTRFGTYRAEESEYYLRVPRKKTISLQNPQSAHPVPVRAEGLIETQVVRVFGVEMRK